jgi:hypothetical protein
MYANGLAICIEFQDSAVPGHAGPKASSSGFVLGAMA